jgi:predicted DsbA family dithiol-disulfide isomerase
MPDVCITEFTDPSCPWAYSAEPSRRRLEWLYGDSIEWRPRMVGLAGDPEELIDKGFDTAALAASQEKMSREHGMPIDTAERPRMAASVPACRAVVATRLNAPEKERLVLRRLRVRNFSGQLLDEPATIAGAAADAALDVGELEAWMSTDATEAALRSDMALAREPRDAARVLDHKLANWSGGRRYTCPSYEIVRSTDGVRIAVPGFQPFAVYDTILANLVPGLGRREPEPEVHEVLEWAGTPLATREVAVVCNVDHEHAREELGRVAQEQHVGFDGFWTLPG